MKLIVAGATGGVGHEIVRQGLAAGHTITALVRDPSRLQVTPEPEQRDQLAVEQVNVFDAGELVPHVDGADAVISALGPAGRGPTSVTTDGAIALAAAMHKTGVRRLVAISAAGFHTEGDGVLLRGVIKPILGRVLRHAFTDMARMEQVTHASELDETIVCPPMLTDGPHTRRYRTGIDRTTAGGSRLSRADLADAVLRVLTDSETVHHRVVLAS